MGERELVEEAVDDAVDEASVLLLDGTVPNPMSAQNAASSS